MANSLHQKQYRQIIARLLAVREQLGISQVELAKRMSTTQSAVSKVERSERRLDVSEFIQWCGALGISSSEIIAEFDARFRRKSK